MDMMKSEMQIMQNQHQLMSKGLSDNGIEYDPNHPSIIEELLQVISNCDN
jgi:hypothetical protein